MIGFSSRLFKKFPKTLCRDSPILLCLPFSTQLRPVNEFPVHTFNQELKSFQIIYPEDVLPSLVAPHDPNGSELLIHLPPTGHYVNESNITATSLIKSRITSGEAKSSFLVTNLAPVVAQYNQWKQELPMVEPFYAVKCNPDPVVLRLLASLGCGFDCATMGEIDLVMNKLGDGLSFGPLGKAQNSLIYAHPAKMIHMISYAIDCKVGMTVFDGEDELYKIASINGFENMKVLLRLSTDDKSSVCQFSKKFGCPVEEAPKLLQIAKSLGIQVAGCSFHVGSGCGDPEAYMTALNHCLRVFHDAARIGMEPLTVVDIGGGFPGDDSGYGGDNMPSFSDLAAAVRKGIGAFCANLDNGRTARDIRFIAEPGRYFVSASTTIASRVYSRKGGQGKDRQVLYIDDGVYGSFNNVVYDHATPVPRKLEMIEGAGGENMGGMPTAVFGPTCDGLDQICTLEKTSLPRCEVGDWLLFENMGAYTHTASFVFNGYTHIPERIYCNL